MAHSSTMEKLGSPAPDFNLKNWNPLLQQESYQLDSFKNHPSLLVAFFCNHCPYVKAIIKELVIDCKDLKKEGQPEPLSYFALESKSFVPHPIQW